MIKAAKIKNSIKDLTGADRSAIIMIILGTELGADIMEKLEEDQITSIAHAMAGLGMVSAPVVEQVIEEFLGAMHSGADLMGDPEATERMLANFLPDRRVREIMGEIKGPLAGKNLWDMLSQLNEGMIASFLKAENPQTIAAIMTKIPSDVVAKVIPLMPRSLVMDVIKRMIQMEPVSREIMTEIEQSLQEEFMASASRTSSIDPHERMAEILNRVEPDAVKFYMDELEKAMPESLARIKQKMFTFDDLVRLDTGAIAKIMRECSGQGTLLQTALKAASEAVKNTFLSSMPERSKNILIENMENMGPIRMREAQEAQSQIVDIAKRLEEQGEIRLPKGDDEEELIY